MTGIRADQFERVAQGFFEAAALPELWPKALHELALASGAEGVAAHASDGLRTRGTIVSEGVAALYDNFIARWSAPELNSHRARGLKLLESGWRGALTENDIFTPAEMARDPFHQEFIVPAGFPSFAGIVLAKRPGFMMSASIYRRPQQGQYQRSEIALINALTDQLRSAVAIAMRLGISATVRTADAFASLGQPVALIARDGCIVHMSPAFERLINSGVYLKNSRLGCVDPEADCALAAAIGQAIAYDGSLNRPNASVVLPRRNGMRPLVADVIPVAGNARDILQVVAAILTLTDLDAESLGPAEKTLQQAFDLTATEARLAAQIVAGESLPEITRAERIAHDTLRSRLRSIFDKTGTRRQTDLALLLQKLGRRGP